MKKQQFLSPTTKNKRFSEVSFENINSLNENLKQILSCIDDFITISYRLGKTSNNSILYKKKTYTEKSLKTLIKNFKNNIKVFPLKYKKALNHHSKTIKINNSKKFLESKKKEIHKELINGMELFFKGIQEKYKISENDIHLLKDFFKIKINDIVNKTNVTIKNRLKVDKSSNSLTRDSISLQSKEINFIFNFDKHLFVSDQFVSSFIENNNFNIGNTLDYIFNKKSQSNDLVTVLDYYKEDIEKNIFLKNISPETFGKIINIKTLLFPLIKCNVTSYCSLLTIFSNYIKYNNLTYKNNKIILDQNLKNLIYSLLDSNNLTFLNSNEFNFKSINESELKKIIKKQIINGDEVLVIQKYNLLKLVKFHSLTSTKNVENFFLKCCYKEDNKEFINELEKVNFFIRKVLFFK